METKEIFEKILIKLGASAKEAVEALEVLENIRLEFFGDQNDAEIKIATTLDDTDLYLIREQNGFMPLEDFLISRIIRNTKDAYGSINFKEKFLHRLRIKNITDFLMNNNPELTSPEAFTKHFDYLEELRTYLKVLKVKNVISKKDLEKVLKEESQNILIEKVKRGRRGEDVEIDVSPDVSIESVIIGSKRKVKSQIIRSEIDSSPELLEFEKESRKNQEEFPEGQNQKQILKQQYKTQIKIAAEADLERIEKEGKTQFSLGESSRLLLGKDNVKKQETNDYVMKINKILGNFNVFAYIFLNNPQVFLELDNHFKSKLNALQIPESVLYSINHLLNELDNGKQEVKAALDYLTDGQKQTINETIIDQEKEEAKKVAEQKNDKQQEKESEDVNSQTENEEVTNETGIQIKSKEEDNKNITDNNNQEETNIYEEANIQNDSKNDLQNISTETKETDRRANVGEYPGVDRRVVERRGRTKQSNEDPIETIKNYVLFYTKLENKYEISRRDEEEEYNVDLTHYILDNKDGNLGVLEPENGVYGKQQVYAMIRLLMTAKLISLPNGRNFYKELLANERVINILENIKNDPIYGRMEFDYNNKHQKQSTEITRLEKDRMNYGLYVNIVPSYQEKQSAYEDMIMKIKNSSQNSFSINLDNKTILKGLEKYIKDDTTEKILINGQIATLKLLARIHNLYPTEEKLSKNESSFSINKQYITYVREQLIEEIKRILSNEMQEIDRLKQKFKGEM